MIIVRRGTPSLQRNILSLSTNSAMSSPPPLVPASTSSSASSSCGGASASSSCGSGGQSKSFDWDGIFTAENKLRTIQLLTLDRENLKINSKIVESDLYDRKAAVLIPLCYDKNGRPSLLYNLRSERLAKHKGEISFPGGSLDPEDNGSPVAAALRETHEELGISSDKVEIWTTLRVFPTVSTSMGVFPVLGLIKGMLDPDTLTVSKDEVDFAFTVTLEHLCDPINWEEGPQRTWKGQAYRMPNWTNLNVFNGKSESVKLWGLTAYVTHLTLTALLPKDVYKRRLPYLKLQLKELTNPPKL